MVLGDQVLYLHKGSATWGGRGFQRFSLAACGFPRSCCSSRPCGLHAKRVSIGASLKPGVSFRLQGPKP